MKNRDYPLAPTSNPEPISGPGPKVSYVSPSGTTLTLDTSGIAAGKRRFPMEIKGNKSTSYSMVSKKGAEKVIKAEKEKSSKFPTPILLGNSKKAKKLIS